MLDIDNLITKLRTAARRTLDSAEFEEAGIERHRPEYTRCIFAEIRTKEQDERIEDLYPFVILAARNAQQYRADAEVFAAAADMLERDLKSRSVLEATK
jgi:hypothetical protein